MKKLHLLVLLSLPLFVLHTIEEYLAMYTTLLALPHNPLELTPEKGAFLAIDLSTWVVLGFLCLLILRKKLPNVFLIFPGALYLFQIEHPINALKLQGYYAGLFTGTLLFILGVFFWKEIVFLHLEKKEVRRSAGKRKR